MGAGRPPDVSTFRRALFSREGSIPRQVPSTVSYVRITDEQLDRVVPVESAVGTIEIDLSDDEATIILPTNVSVTIERSQGP
jgi:hypothetical protein